MGAGEEPVPTPKDVSSSAPVGEKKKEVDPQAVQGMLTGALLLIIVAAVFEQIGGAEMAKAQTWANSLFEPHVVPPPKAKKDQVVIQFCQS